MLHSLIKETLTSQLEEVSGLANQYAKNDLNLVKNVEVWLEKTEKLMAQFRFSEVGLIASARGRIYSKAEFPFESEDVSRKRKEKAKLAAAWEAIEEVSKLIQARIRESENKLRTFDEKLCEGLTAFSIHNTMPLECGLQEGACYLWQGLKAYEPTKPLASYVESSLAAHDRVYILEEILERIRSKLPFESEAFQR